MYIFFPLLKKASPVILKSLYFVLQNIHIYIYIYNIRYYLLLYELQFLEGFLSLRKTDDINSVGVLLGTELSYKMRNYT